MPVRRRNRLLLVLLLAIGLFDVLLLRQRARYRDEAARLQTGMTALERTRTATIVAAQADRAALMLELMRRQSGVDQTLHLAVNTESSYVALDRGPDRLRRFAAEIGPGRPVGAGPDTLHIAVPRGVRTVLAPAPGGDALPTWLWRDRGLPVPSGRPDPRWLGPDAIVTSGGTLIYAQPDSGPLADLGYVMPGSIRVPAHDLAAIRESVSPGMRVYFF